MEPVVAKFQSFEEADRADLEYYRRLTPAQRLDILRTLIGDGALPERRETIAALNSCGVEYLIVGGFAMAYHGVPRLTGDIDFFVANSPENVAGIERALGLLGQPPNRIDLLTSITGVAFEEAWRERVPAELDGLPVHFIGRAALIRNKRATGRARDLADLESLG